MDGGLYRSVLILASSVPTMPREYAIGTYGDIMPVQVREAFSLGDALGKWGFDIKGQFERFFIIEPGTGRKLYEIKQLR